MKLAGQNTWDEFHTNYQDFLIPNPRVSLRACRCVM